MKLNNKGFAISSIMYIILVLSVILMVITLSLLGNRKLIIDKLKGEVISGIYSEESISPSKICIAYGEQVEEDVEIVIGTEYICEVKKGVKYNFFVLSSDNDNVNLIMDSNIDPNGNPIKNDNIANTTVNWGTEAIAYLNEATKDWKYIDNLNETYNTFTLTGKARLPKLDEVTSSECGCNNGIFASCKNWLVNYTYNEDFYGYLVNISNVYGYWTLDSGSTEFASGGISVIGEGMVKVDYSNIGVRPVISVHKSKLS